ncbi:MAG: putative glycoside hydrolase, partial [Longimicrobiales bacterium]|nr:putative glycoside hydrolase [Longimicrobiales bacterium]
AFAALLFAACEDPITGPGSGAITLVPRPAVVRGVYVNAQAAGRSDRISDLLALAGDSEINTFVIDVKERGEVSYESQVALVGEADAERGYTPDLSALLAQLKKHGIYPIVRIVCFYDPVLASARSDLAIRTANDDLWLDLEGGIPWVDPYSADVWAYNIDLAREALEAGFAEIQWDYVRFPDVADSARAEMIFPARNGRSAVEAIQQFVATSRSELAAFGAPITADVFGRVITTDSDSIIGQDWDELIRVTDVILPMVYPALYAPGNFQIPDPNANPYLLVKSAMDRAVARTEAANGSIATIRPWLQAFTQGSPVYGSAEMKAQIQAVEDAGLFEWLFWNPNSIYPRSAFQ